MPGTVAGKLTILVTVSLIVVFGLGTWLNVMIQERAAHTILSRNGASIADMIAGATRESMLHNDRERIAAMVDSLARQPDVERIRILRKTGEIAYSTVAEELGSILDSRLEQCITCHQQPQPPEMLPAAERVRVIESGGRRALGITRVIYNEPDCSTAACHEHRPDERLLGILDVHLALGPYDEARVRSALELVLTSAVAIFLVLVTTIVSVQKMVQAPVRALIRGARKLGDGDLSARVPETSDDEIGELARTFNQLARDLEIARGELMDLTQTLEVRVEQKTRELKEAQDQVLHAEKMASLGKLAAVVAHEINNPLSSVVTYARTLVRRLREGRTGPSAEQNLQCLESIASEATRCGAIVSQLLAFARQRGGRFTAMRINDVVEKAVFLLQHQLDMNGVTVRRELAPDLPVIVADPDQVQQASMALLINASQALEGGGTVTLRTRSEEAWVVLEVADDGPGMPPEVAERVFEPFFTTREEDGGLGLGLSVVYGILERHGGSVSLQTAPGDGCCFTLRFPLEPPDQENSR
ncbi:MAG: ATP-binding protein [Acidobacteriota bacterium]|nr:ATP-binding protein [Acidobacteriota bacterium]